MELLIFRLPYSWKLQERKESRGGGGNKIRPPTLAIFVHWSTKVSLLREEVEMRSATSTRELACFYPFRHSFSATVSKV